MGKKLSKQVSKQLLNILFLVALIVITVVVLFACNKELDFNSIGAFLARCNPWWIAAAFVAMAFSVLFEAFSLHFILRGLGEKPKLLSSVVYSTADIYYSAITPSASGGQPASAYYMVKDGIGAGKASFALVYNLIGYTFAIIAVGAFAFIVHPEYFGQIDAWFAHLLIILGFVLQSLLLLFFIGCMFWSKAVLKLGNGIITLLVKIRLVKKEEKWRGKLKGEVEKYRSCLRELKTHPFISIANLICNLAQRVCQVLICCFVYKAADPSSGLVELFCLQSLVLIGYNSIPLPGGVGVFEYLYLNIYCISFPSALILPAVMVTRGISYYIRFILCGVYTLGYHVRLMHKGAKNTQEETNDVSETPAITPNDGDEAEGE